MSYITDLQARIAELEAERDGARRVLNEQLKGHGAAILRIASLDAALGEATGRIETDGKLITELEAERDRFREALQWYADHLATGGRRARAALSPTPSGE